LFRFVILDFDNHALSYNRTILELKQARGVGTIYSLSQSHHLDFQRLAAMAAVFLSCRKGLYPSAELTSPPLRFASIFSNFFGLRILFHLGI